MVIDIVPFSEKICQHGYGVQHVLVKQHDETVASFDFQAAARQSNIHSATKSVLSLAVGIAIGEGKLSLDAHPTKLLRDHLPPSYDPAWDAVTLLDLLTMASGHLDKLLSGYSARPDEITRDQLPNTDWVNYAFSMPPKVARGKKFVYNNACPIIAARMVAAAVGEPLFDWMRPRLFDPMGIRNPQWLTEPDGAVCGAGGLQLTPEQFSRFAQLCLHQGVWNGQRLVPADYIADASRAHIATGEKGGKPSALSGYGYYFWVFEGDDAYCFNGWGGQIAIVLPNQNATVTLMSQEMFRIGEVLDLVWAHLMPALRANA